MLLIIDGQPRPFMAVEQFRQLHHLPDDFGVSRFGWIQPPAHKRLAHVRDQFRELRDAVMRIVLHGNTSPDWMSFGLKLELVFRQRLLALSPVLELSPFEVDHFAGCFGDLCRSYIYYCLCARESQVSIPLFQAVYVEWLSKTTWISPMVQSYWHEGQQWRIQVITNAFGHAGLIIQAESETYFVEHVVEHNPTYRFVISLAVEVAARLGSAISRDPNAVIPHPFNEADDMGFPFRRPGKN